MNHFKEIPRFASGRDWGYGAMAFFLPLNDIHLEVKLIDLLCLSRVTITGSFL